MTRKKLGKGAYGDRGHRVALWIEGDRIVGQYRAGPVGGKERKKRSWPNTAENRAFAKAWAEELSQTLRGRGPGRTLVTVRDLFNRYAEAEFSALRPRSQQLARDAWRAWERFVGTTTIAEDLGPETVAAFKGDLERRPTRSGAGWAISSIGKAIGQVKTVYAWAHRHRLITRNEVRDYRFKVGKAQRRDAPAEYTAAEVAAIEAELPLDRATTWRAGALFRLANLLGGRQQSIRRLRWDDIDLEAGTVVWRSEWDKNGREEVSPLRPAAVAVLRAIQDRAVRGWVLPSTSDRAEVYTAQSAIATLRAAERRAGVVWIRQRAYHGLRRKHFNDVLEAAAGDVGTAAAALRDRDLRVLSKSYLKKRNPKLAAVYRAMDAAERPANGTERPNGAEMTEAMTAGGTVAGIGGPTTYSGPTSAMTQCTAQDLNLEPSDEVAGPPSPSAPDSPGELPGENPAPTPENPTKPDAERHRNDTFDDGPAVERGTLPLRPIFAGLERLVGTTRAALAAEQGAR